MTCHGKMTFVDKPFLVYFSSATENTKHFVDRLPYESLRLPVYRNDPEVFTERPFIFFVPTYGAGKGEGAVPPQARKFLNHPEHRRLCVGVIGGGNINFGEKYAAAADVLAGKLGVPVLYRFELRGLPEDLVKVEEGIENNWELLLKLRGIQKN